MTSADKRDEQESHVNGSQSSPDPESTLLPMLIGGLVLTVIGLIVVMVFV